MQFDPGSCPSQVHQECLDVDRPRRGARARRPGSRWNGGRRRLDLQGRVDQEQAVEWRFEPESPKPRQDLRPPRPFRDRAKVHPNRAGTERDSRRQQPECTDHAADRSPEERIRVAQHDAALIEIGIGVNHEHRSCARRDAEHFVRDLDTEARALEQLDAQSTAAPSRERDVKNPVDERLPDGNRDLRAGSAQARESVRALAPPLHRVARRA